MKKLLLGLIISFMFACETTQIIDVDLIDREFSPISNLESFEWIEYQIQEGDYISSIASRFNVSPSTIVIYNDIQNFSERETIKIPNIDGICHIVKSDETIFQISRRYNIPLQVIIDVNSKENDTVTEGEVLFIPGAEKSPDIILWWYRDTFILPVYGSIGSSFGWKRDPLNDKYIFHTGIDLTASIGAPVKAAMTGIVTETGSDRMYGQYIIIGHNNFYHTLYAHLSFVSVNQGDRVTQGDIIGNVGNTGYCTGSYLHFGIYKYGKVVNPINLLE